MPVGLLNSALVPIPSSEPDLADPAMVATVVVVKSILLIEFGQF
jgi:hypothetical protein